MDRGAWHVHRVTKSQTRMKWLSMHILKPYETKRGRSQFSIPRKHFQIRWLVLQSVDHLEFSTSEYDICTVLINVVFGYSFSSSHVWMWELDHKEGWAPKNWCIQTVVLEKILESLLDCKEIKPVDPKEINLEYSLEGLMLKLKLQHFGHLIQRADSLWKDPDPGQF